MSEFITVLGNDPYYKSLKTYMHVAIHSIQKVCPIYAVKSENGTLWRCRPDHDGAHLVSHQLTDFNGITYSCGNPQELEKLGVVEPKPKPIIGFVNQENNERLEVEVEED